MLNDHLYLQTSLQPTFIFGGIWKRMFMKRPLILEKKYGSEKWRPQTKSKKKTTHKCSIKDAGLYYARLMLVWDVMKYYLNILVNEFWYFIFFTKFFQRNDLIDWFFLITLILRKILANVFFFWNQHSIQ